jgi:hypothetical protein
LVEEAGMYSVREAADKLGMTDRHVRLLLARGEIYGRKLGHDWVVLSLDYERKRRPKKKRGVGETAANTSRQKPDDVWTEGSL